MEDTRTPPSARAAHGERGHGGRSVRPGRARTDLAGNVQERYTSLPFGDLLTTWNDNWQPTSPAVGAISPLHFTGQPRDAGTGFDDFGARYNSSTLGRWMTPDPAGNLVASPANPQSWNQYAYVLNNPATLIDPTGLLYCKPPNEEGVANCIPDNEWNKLSQVQGEDDIHYDSSDDGKQAGGDVNSNAFADLIALLRASQNAQRQAWIQQAQRMPTNHDYMVAIRQAFSHWPDICSGGIQGRIGRGSAAIGFDLNSRTGLNGTARIQTNIEPVTIAGSATTSGRTSLSGSVRIPDTPVSIGGATPDGRRISNINIGIRAKAIFSLVGYASLGQMHQCH